MAAVPVSLMHHSGLQIPTQMMTPMLPACSINSSMLSMNVPAMTGTMTMAAANTAMNYPQFQSQQPQIQHQAPPQIQLPTSQEHYLNGEAAMSPSRSVAFLSADSFSSALLVRL